MKAYSNQTLQNYLQARERLKVGDIIAFYRYGSVLSKIIQIFTGKRIDHLAVVSNIDENIITITEALPFKVRAIDFDKYIMNSGAKARVWVHHLKIPLEDTAQYALQGYLFTKLGKPYDFFGAALSAVDHKILPFLKKFGYKPVITEGAKSKYFCSYLVSRALQVAGLTTLKYTPKYMNPAEVLQSFMDADFIDDGILVKDVSF